MKTPAYKYLSFRSRPKPLLFKSTPTLAGLRSEGERVFTWNQVRPASYAADTLFWEPLDAYGQVLQEEGRPIRLQFPSGQVRDVAKRAHARGLREAWRKGAFLIQAEGAVRRGDTAAVLTVSTILAGCSVVLTGQVLLRAWQNVDWEMLSGQVLLLMVLGSLSLLACGVGPGILAVWLFGREFRDLHLRRIRIDSSGIEAEMDYGAVMQASWEQIRDLTVSTPRFADILLRDGQVMRLGPLPPQIIRALRVIQPFAIERAVIQARVQRARHHRNVLACFVLLASIGAGVLEYTICRDLPEPARPAIAGIGAIGVVTASLLIIPSPAEAFAATRLGQRWRDLIGHRRRLRSARERLNRRG